MLKSMGWEEGKGLGANEQGATEVVKVRVNDGNRGIGEGPPDHNSNWLKGIEDFNSILGKLSKSQEMALGSDALGSDALDSDSPPSVVTGKKRSRSQSDQKLSSSAPSSPPSKQPKLNPDPNPSKSSTSSSSFL